MDIPPSDQFLPGSLTEKLKNLENNTPKPLLISIPSASNVLASPSSSRSSVNPIDHTAEGLANPPPEDTFPAATPQSEIPLVDQEDLSPLERIYCFSISKATFHRVYIAENLPQLMDEVDASDAVVYVLPLLSGLAMDQDDQVKEAMASKLIDILWWFFTKCRAVLDESLLFPEPQSSTTSFQLSPTSSIVSPVDSRSSLPAFRPPISVAAFTPIIGTLLLSPNPTIAENVRFAVVELLRRIRHEDDTDSSNIDSDDAPSGFLGKEARELIAREILQQVVIGMGRLGDDADEEDLRNLDSDPEQEFYDVLDSSSISTQSSLATTKGDSQQDVPRIKLDSDSTSTASYNPYFPAVPPSSSSPSGSSPSGSSPSTSSPGTFSSPSSSPSGSSASSSARESPSTNGLHVTGASLNPRVSPTWFEYQEMPYERVSGLAYGSLTQPPQGPPPHVSGSQPELRPTKFPSAVSGTATDVPQSSAGESASSSPMDEEDDSDEQNALGRLSSISLIAAVAASGCIDDETKNSFVQEVTRVVQDDIYWVRREASFALGALAKIIPKELVVSSLLPLFESFRTDSIWHVRHSTLLCLPALLSRLTPSERRKTALASIIPLSRDEIPTVRLGTYESLGEVIYSFADDAAGPPEELLRLFLSLAVPQHSTPSAPPLDIIPVDQDDATRALICAFNFPAVTLTLGHKHWDRLRDAYLTLAQSPNSKVWRTLAASLGEMAKIIGLENARRDLLSLWMELVRVEEQEVSVKLAGSIETFMRHLDLTSQSAVLKSALFAWEEGSWRGWREREIMAATLGQLVDLAAAEEMTLQKLLMKGLEDSVAAVREAALTSLPVVWRSFSLRRSPCAASLKQDISALGKSANHKKRMTFIACQQVLVTHRPETTTPDVEPDDSFWAALSKSGLVDDPILGVRIGLGRLVGSFLGPSGIQTVTSRAFTDILKKLSKDSSSEVRTYILRRPGVTSDFEASCSSSALPSPSALFSRPPS